MFGGPEGSAETAAGDFLYVPPHLVHREANPGSVAARAVVVRIGEGVPVVNVPGPG